LRERAAGADPSDAGIAIYERQQQEVAADPPPLPAGGLHVAIDTTHPDPAPIEPLLAVLSRSGVVTPRIPELPLRFRA
jgi:hypothetical protein